MIRLWIFIALCLSAGAPRPAPAQTRQRFDHQQHQNLFPTCLSCHGGAADPARELWPSSGNCAACHDGRVEKAVEWQPPSAPSPNNLRFTHRQHAALVQRAAAGDSALACETCHSETGSRMRIRLALVQRCLDCHHIQSAHLAAPDTSCATCHVPLPLATRLTPRDIADFPVPDSHRRSDFTTGHGKLARGSLGESKVSAACATCHARDFCAECHVNAPEVPAIQALGPDPRSAAPRVELKAPPDHKDPDFLIRHGAAVRRSATACATCHTQESCLSCHVTRPSALQLLPVAGPGRAGGAKTRRERPPSHGGDFSETHGSVASARPESCEGCHARPQCLDCHRPNPADATPGYHPAGFLSRHPAAAYSRETNCSDCHNTGQFCADCHVKAGLSARGELNGGYHDAKQFFLLGHGQAARQNLESCVACHSERDCLTCHSALSGRRFDPHGPGFDPDRLRRKNSQMCTACHGALIPDADR